MSTFWYSHEACHLHVTPRGHPERVERIAAVNKALEPLGLTRHEAPLADAAETFRCHPESHLARVRDAVPETGFAQLDPDTWLSPGSLPAALHGIGGIEAAIDAVLSGQATNAFSGCRPPGHHAETEKPMGFCLFGTVAIGAKYALDKHGLSRVAIVDFDVHHGNGTQDLMWNEERVLFCSSHQMPLYPGTGAVTERGAHGNILNAPLEPGTGGAEMRRVYEREILPAVEAFDPELILVSAGFDAHANDPLAQLEWTEADFTWVTERLCDLADKTCDGRLVSTLEGGYDLDALAASVAAHLRVLQDRS